ncbi:hypothetical protein RRG08_045024 [Elysia crispata]|uniref:Uncharacterized protein n=1 Tax=Elysia crispata TaxID=231223 RepID=A0AAE1CRZ9_9GAST|nr:hypothetical protein RRG08_045024 [Elysia crispata]
METEWIHTYILQSLDEPLSLPPPPPLQIKKDQSTIPPSFCHIATKAGSHAWPGDVLQPGIKLKPARDRPVRSCPGADDDSLDLVHTPLGCSKSYPCLLVF